MVTTAMRYVAGAYCTKKEYDLMTKYDLNRTQDRRVIYIKLWLPWQPSYHSNKVADAYRPKEDHAKCKVNMT